MTKMKKLIYVLALLPFMFCSCEDKVSDQQGESGEGMKKLVKEVVYQKDEDSEWKEVFSFAYDSVGRLKEVRVDGETELIYEYNDGVLLVKSGENDPDPVFVYFGDDGLISTIDYLNGKEYFTYDEDSNLQTLTYKGSGLEATYRYIWKGGNVTEVTAVSNLDTDSFSLIRYTYYEIEDKLNINLLALFESGIICMYDESVDKSMFRGIYNRNLLKRIEQPDEYGNPDYVSFSYEFDSDGYPTKISILEWGATISIKY